MPKLPIIPPSLLKNRTVAAGAVLTFFNGSCFYSILFQVPLFCQVICAPAAWRPGLTRADGYGATHAGVLLLPFLCVIAPGVLAVGQAMARGLQCALAHAGLRPLTSADKHVIVPGFALLAVALGLLSTLNESSPYGQLIGYLIFAGISISVVRCFQRTLLTYV